MTNELLTVVTATLGDSCRRLDIFLGELRRFTRLDYRHIVCDDGTPDPEEVEKQKEVCAQHKVEHIRHPGPEHGVSFNLNFALEQVETPWVFILEDGLRASQGWLECAVSFLEQVHQKPVCGYEVGMAGTTGLQDWMFALEPAIPTQYTAMDFLHRNYWETVQDFYGDWN